MAESSTRTVERALVLLGAVCDAGSIPLADAARETGLSASTALRLLRTLEGTGFVRRDAAGAYRPGLRVVQLGVQALAHESLVSLAEPALERLVALTGESAYLSVPSHDGEGIYLAMREGTHSVRHASWVGRSIPLDGTAVGAVLRGEEPAAGFVVVRNGIEADITAIAAPVSPGGQVVAAISVVIPSYRITPAGTRRIGALVAAEADALLAHIPSAPAGQDLTGEPA
ncbi:IclR family transcriptional regulator [Arthrobacter agilis]|uniref:IclR family transcriptional regulator n=1 Tax=Arthrobacter agilis TaxID=37921 RepID=UPI000B3569BE|nr:IclR family transcriptional regulator [Arthrobacter agilis]OUM40432.1 transcriptional regulator [Arthrobacter agilis]PPB45047.1 IclR family transcriptional regulator [Arthrobacter agilis]TPV27750.1 IclR family transcriptional regulator [Arthrobacter agilis]VDR31604.1 Pectin degradation repressor protein kdgR [Arthrobacter agilis]